ncbi:histidine kinase [Mongoliitalea lutea]|uniref:Histidine kinase n=1 Tax=Mongoliitalea lutea TaxID=849756 RepID=A0A8J3CWS2_9BACT|nr:histidine kinase [Mongoliitalea lutea]
MYLSEKKASYLILSKASLNPHLLSKAFIGILIWICSISFVQAQQQITKKYSIADGLPNNSIRSLFVDSREMLWIGTENGVSVKRNQEFLNFFMEDGLAFNSCWAITEDKDRKMWFGSYGGGVSMFDGKHFHKIQDGLYTQFIRTLHTFEDYILVGTTNGLNLIDYKNLSVTKVQGSQGNEDHNFISGFFVYQDRLFYTTYRNGVFEVLLSDGTFTAEKINDFEYIYGLHQQEEMIVLSGKEELLHFNADNLISKNPRPERVEPSSNFYNFQKTAFGLLGTATGLYSPNGGVFEISPNQVTPFNDRLQIDSRNLWSMAYHTASSTLYLGSLDKGLYEVNLSKRILLFDTKGVEILGFAGDDQLEALLRSDGLHFPLLSKKLSLTDFKTVQQRYFANPKAWIPKLEDDFYELNPRLTAEEIIFYGIRKHDNSFWINSNIGIYQVSTTGNFIRYLPLHSLVIGFSPDGHLIESNPYGGLRIYTDISNPKNYQYYRADLPETPDMLSQIVQKNSKTYFSSVFAGLFRLDENRFFSFKESGIWDVEKIKSIYPTSGNQLIVGAEFGDVFLITDEEDFKEVLKIAKSTIYGNSIIGVKAFRDAILIMTEQGINIYQNGNIKLIDAEQGLRKTIIKSYKIIGEDLYLGYEDAYLKVHLPSILSDSYRSYQLKITKLLVDFNPFSTDKIEWFSYSLERIILKNFPSSLLIQLQPHRLLYPEKLQYRYRLSPDQEWTPFSTSNEIFLTYLNYGDYSLEVEVFDLHSGKTEYFNLLEIKALPPFYLQTWFIILSLFLAIITILIIFRIRISQIKETEAVERKIAETKLEALRSQMNPHFIFNAINSIQYFILKNDTDRAVQFLSKFSKLIRKTLDNSKSNRIKLSQEADYLRAYMAVENERMANRVQWDVSLDSNLDPEFIEIPPMLLQPFIENAFVHAFPASIEKPKITVLFEGIDQGNMSCLISDNGIGISEKTNKSHRSRGLELVSERISLLPNALPDAISIQSQERIGTTIRVKIPVITHGPMQKYVQK